MMNMEEIENLFNSANDYDKVLSDLLERLSQLVTLHPVQLILRWSAFDGKLDDLKSNLKEYSGWTYHGSYSDDKINQIQSLLNQCGWDSIPYSGITRLSAFSKTFGNPNLRGNACDKMGFSCEDFRWETTNPTGITLKDFTEAVYRLKG